MMSLLDIVNRSPAPAPWSEGDNIPWNEPGFSQRMLGEHLSQEHDMASRRVEKIDQQVAWIHRYVLDQQATRILDLGCGPGLYTSRLARLGHTCQGIDFSPSSIAYAAGQAARENLSCSYQQEDIRFADYGSGWGLVMLIYGEFNVFPPVGARAILQRARAALSVGGSLLLEPHTYLAVRALGGQGAAWYTASSGLFAPTPHLALRENFWHQKTSVATTRWFIVEATSARVARYAASYQAYTEDEYRQLLMSAGFSDVEFLPSLLGSEDPTQSDFCAILAHAD